MHSIYSFIPAHSLTHPPAPHVLLDDSVGLVKHGVVLDVAEENVRLQQVLVKTVQPGPDSTQLPHPLPCVDVYHIA